MSMSPQDPRSNDSPGPAGRRRAALLAAGLCLALAAAAVRAPAQKPAKKAAPRGPAAAAQAPSPAAAPQPAPAVDSGDLPAGKVFKNITVLQDVPASQMGPIMHVMRASLGVRCDYCHVLAGDRYDLDTLPAKETSRQMIRMVLAINQEHFGGRSEVTCETCHNGHAEPARAPAAERGFILGPVPPPPPVKLPTSAELLDRYIQALGGRRALLAVKSRVSRGALIHLKVVGAGTPGMHGVNRGQEDPLEVVESLPDHAVMTFGPPDAQVVETFDGPSVRIRTAAGEHPASPQDAARLANRFDLRRELKLRDRADSSRVVGKDKIDGKDVYLLSTRMPDGNAALLAFDAETGLLRRQTLYRPTVIGPDPERTDFADYRDVGGVKVPFLVNFMPLDDFHSGNTRKLSDVRDNVLP
jgi:Photosynthetic reaction centre cytochrome C subunit